MWIVFRVRHKLRQREEALKVIHDRPAYNKEARMLDTLDHLNIEPEEECFLYTTELCLELFSAFRYQ